jgi:ABC-type phosphate/phosphonate transport system permease subunit
LHDQELIAAATSYDVSAPIIKIWSKKDSIPVSKTWHKLLLVVMIVAILWRLHTLDITTEIAKRLAIKGNLLHPFLFPLY